MHRASSSSLPVFVSYAWGDSAGQKKSWIHEKIVSPLELNGFTVFWDHESILPGRSFTQAISAMLREGDVDILCICDSDFINSAGRSHSGVAQELEILAGEASHRDIRIIPLVVESLNESALPALLADRRCVDLTTLIESGTSIGGTLKLVLEHATSPVIEKDIADRVRRTRIYDRASVYFGAQSWEVVGDPVTRRVLIGDSRPLLPARWMYADHRFSDHVNTRRDRYEPGAGIWHWEYGPAVRTMLTLGVAVSSEFFSQQVSEHVGDIVTVGYEIARNVICLTKYAEPLMFDWSDCVQMLLGGDRWTDALDRLIP
ncbi:hypothetical protein CFB89_14460 [Burkholderia sp. AU16741]|uniref:toll/interleukin-1 receptor domain-containing protein n=1 Tax=unclassified Burkholderia TaxID=2613784 RepID=UPI000B7A36FE|nr:MULTISPECIES: toll/interleukin-1 receptor domain-containing protein [unclassified Burkholderia]MDN7429916.1 toll/interleukin-1 receptor domain-containing protein [Burkholderia sp. AU45388]OXI32327.1 hypothetical protein CFB89_14460 [Burkholderia sp. AU16741]